MEERIDLLVESKPRGGVSVATVVSLIVHSLLILYLIRSYRPVMNQRVAEPIVHYVELMRQNPRQFTEAPGAKVARAPQNAPFSDANRKASMPTPTGTRPTTRPGENGAVWTPPSRPAGDGRQPTPPSPSIRQAPSPGGAEDPAGAHDAAQANPASGFAFRQPARSASGAVDWRDAIKQVGQSAASGSGPRGMDLGGAGGGEQGFAESGPLSFESQWYDWGDYAASMVSRIRVNWYSNMPQLIRTGMKGVVTIRFTIHRDGQITDVVILNSSGVPPYDNAAAQAIRLSSPLRPLPKDFPNDTERVTCMFYYNMEIPNR